MQNEDSIVAFILGFGTNAQLLEPACLIDKIKKDINDMKELYC